jgi:hypothetical protein
MGTSTHRVDISKHTREHNEHGLENTQRICGTGNKDWKPANTEGKAETKYGNTVNNYVKPTNKLVKPSNSAQGWESKAKQSKAKRLKPN